MKIITEELYRKIKVLSEIAWNGLGKRPAISDWLDNFDDEKFRVNALYLLSQFVFFSKSQIDEMLISIYRDLYRYPIIYKIRKENGNTLDEKIIEDEFLKYRKTTKFVSLGGSSESSAHLMYPFRMNNKLHTSEIISDNEIENLVNKKDNKITKFIFIDDLAGSGTQVERYLKDKLVKIKSNNLNITFSYFVLLGTENGIQNLQNLKIFEEVKPVYLLDETFKVFNTCSRYYKGRNIPECIDKDFACQLAGNYGDMLYRTIWKLEGKHEREIPWLADRDKLGFKDCQLLIGFHHNTPSNTLPIIWYNEKEQPWTPIFKRFNKIYKKPNE